MSVSIAEHSQTKIFFKKNCLLHNKKFVFAGSLDYIYPQNRDMKGGIVW